MASDKELPELPAVNVSTTVLKGNGDATLRVRDGSSRGSARRNKKALEQLIEEAFRKNNEIDRVADRVDPLPEDAIPVVRICPLSALLSAIRMVQFSGNTY